MLCIHLVYKYVVLFVNTRCLIDTGIIGGCSELCGELAKYTDNLAGEVCDILCVLVGFEEFVKIIEW